MSILDEEVPSLQQPAEGIGVAEYGGVNYPNNMNAASQAFLDGYYNTEMVFTATTNEIRIGVKKTEAVTNDWTIFDNCRLTYLGGLDVSVYKDAYEKALEAANAALNDEAYAAVVGSERDDLAEAINSLGNVSGSQDAYSEAQQALDEATKKFTDAKAAYDAYAVAQELSADAYQYAAAEKVNAYTQAIQAEPTSMPS
jgi:tetratricopeptide (TPR) repeat protein